MLRRSSLVDQSRTYMNRIAGYSAYEEGNFELAKQYMDKLFANLDADRIIKKDYIYYARILARKNQNYAKLIIDVDNDADELSKLQARYATLKSPAKEQAKASIDALQVRVEEVSVHRLRMQKPSLQSHSKHMTRQSDSMKRKTSTCCMKREPFSTVPASTPMQRHPGHCSLIREGTVKPISCRLEGLITRIKPLTRLTIAFNKMVAKYP